MNETMTTALCRPSCVSVGGVDAGLPAGNGLCIIDGARRSLRRGHGQSSIGARSLSDGATLRTTCAAATSTRMWHGRYATTKLGALAH